MELVKKQVEPTQQIWTLSKKQAEPTTKTGACQKTSRIRQNNREHVKKKQCLCNIMTKTMHVCNINRAENSDIYIYIYDTEIMTTKKVIDNATRRFLLPSCGALDRVGYSANMITVAVLPISVPAKIMANTKRADGIMEQLSSINAFLHLPRSFFNRQADKPTSTSPPILANQ